MDHMFDVASIRSFSKNEQCIMMPFMQLKLRSVTVEHVQRALSRISQYKVEASRLSTERPGMFVSLRTKEPKMTDEDIEALLTEFKFNLSAIVKASRDRIEENLKSQGLISTSMASTRHKQRPVRTPVQRQHH